MNPPSPVSFQRLGQFSRAALVVATLASSTGALGVERSRIDLVIEGRKPSFVAATMHLEPSDQPRALDLRSIPSQSPVHGVRCDSGHVEVDEFSWQLPRDCRKLRWRIELESLDAHYDPASQKSAYSAHRGQALIFEWGAMPRIDGNPAPRVCLSTDDARQCHDLPSTDRPPLILAAGFERAASGPWGTLWSDRDDLPALTEAAAGFGRQAVSLRKLLLADNAPPIQVLWLERDPGSLGLGGVAGHDLIIANYPGGVEETESEGLMLARWISGHETVHLFGHAQLPLWAGESLAHYLGYRTLAEDIGISPAQRLWQRYMAMPKSGDTLEVLQQRVEAGDGRARATIYVEGARLWAEIDALLPGSSDSANSFFHFLQALLADSWLDQSGLPAPACRQLLDHIEPERLLQLSEAFFNKPLCRD